MQQFQAALSEGKVSCSLCGLQSECTNVNTLALIAAKGQTDTEEAEEKPNMAILLPSLLSERRDSAVSWFKGEAIRLRNRSSFSPPRASQLKLNQPKNQPAFLASAAPPAFALWQQYLK